MGNKDYSEKYHKSIAMARGAFIATAIAAGGLASVSVLQDIIVINLGIQAFHGLRTVFMGCSAIGAITSAGTVISALIVKRTEDKAKIPDKQPDTAFLKVKGDLDPETVREELSNKYKEWPEKKIASECEDIILLMEQMNEYQAKLNTLLKSNGADALRDTEDILDKVEQHICRNVRKLINIMLIADKENRKDIQMVTDTADNCLKDNEKLLGTTRDFVFAVTQFLNEQGNENTSEEEIQGYRDILLSQINNGGI